MATKEPAKQPHVKVHPQPCGQMTITRDFLAAIGFERENEGERPYKPPDIEVWVRTDFVMSVAFYTEPKKAIDRRIELGRWDDIEKESIADFVNDLLERQRAHFERL
jgi:hypothetical protein